MEIKKPGNFEDIWNADKMFVVKQCVGEEIKKVVMKYLDRIKWKYNTLNVQDATKAIGEIYSTKYLC